MAKGIEGIRVALEESSDPRRKEHAPRYFKAGPGEYAEGDLFLGVPVPDQRAIAKEFGPSITLEELGEMLIDPIHEMRLTGVFILVNRMKKAKSREDQRPLVDLYLASLKGINNWDLVDSSAPHILGPWTFEEGQDMLYDFAGSGDLWKQRIAILTTQFYIRKGYFSTTLHLAKILLHHPHDLIHKAVGWMLREVGEKDPTVEYEFLDEHYADMPRTMLRYAIEKFPERDRQEYLKGLR